MPTSPDTLLRRVDALQGRMLAASRRALRGYRRLGVAARASRYGTIVVDLERSDVVDLLPDRDTKTVAAWLKGTGRN